MKPMIGEAHGIAGSIADLKKFCSSRDGGGALMASS